MRRPDFSNARFWVMSLALLTASGCVGRTGGDSVDFPVAVAGVGPPLLGVHAASAAAPAPAPMSRRNSLRSNRRST